MEHSTSRRQDLTGQRFGRLVVQSMTWEHGQGYAACLCDCGQQRTVIAKYLPAHHIASCGCLQQESRGKAARQDLTGQRFGRLLVQAMQWDHGQTRVCCLCDCGRETTVAASSLRYGLTMSCGCLQRERTAQVKRKDLTGQRFGRLLVQDMYWTQGKGFVRCLCDCGTPIDGSARGLLRMPTPSCGCFYRERREAALLEELIGRRFGRLIVESLQWGTEQSRRPRARCLCDCGAQSLVDLSRLRNGTIQSCGCLRGDRTRETQAYNLTGRRFERLVVYGMRWGQGLPRALCRCACGQEVEVQAGHLRTGHTKSCGCLNARTAAEKTIRRRLDTQRRRARLRGLPDTFTTRHEAFMQQYWQGRCAICGNATDFWHVIAWDHWIPLSHPHSPGTTPGNILPLCHSVKGARALLGPRGCNNAKGNRNAITWLTEKMGVRKATTKLREIERYFAAVSLFANGATSEIDPTAAALVGD